MKNILRNSNFGFTKWCVALIAAGWIGVAQAQVSINGSAAVVENFNTLGASATAALPSGWKMSAAGAGTTAGYSTAANVTATTQAGSGSSTSGGRYNWGDGATATDRAIGFMTSGSYASPSGIMAQYQNNTGGTISTLILTFDIERYRINTAAAQVTFFSSTDGTTWTSQTSGDSGAFTTGSSSYTLTAPSQTVVSKTVTITGLSIASGSSIYFKWNFNTTGSNSQGLGLDNVSVTATTSSGGTPPTVTGISPSSGLAGTIVTITGTDFTGATAVRFNGLAADSFTVNGATSITATAPTGVTTGPIYVTTAGGTATSSGNFTVPVLSIAAPSSINEGDSSQIATVTATPAPTSDLTITLKSSSAADLTVDGGSGAGATATATISANTTEASFFLNAPADSTVDNDASVNLTASAASAYKSATAIVTVRNVDIAPVSITTTGTAYTQNFDELGTGNVTGAFSSTLGMQRDLGSVTSSMVGLGGWYVAPIGGSGPATTLTANDGSSISGGVFSHGTTGASDRALGLNASGSSVFAFGAAFKNDTGVTIESFTLVFSAENWRGATAASKLTFGYGKLGGDITGGNFLSAAGTGVTALASADITGDILTNIALDGNTVKKSVNITLTVGIAPGETLFLRWRDFDDAGSDAALAIDDFRLTANATVITTPPTLTGVTVDQPSLTPTQATVSSQVVTDGGTSVTGQGFVFSPTATSADPTLSTVGALSVTNTPGLGAFTNNLTNLTAGTAYTVKSYAINSAGTNYSSPAAFTTLAAYPTFTGEYRQNFDNVTNNALIPAGWRSLSSSNINSFVGYWTNTNASTGGLYGRDGAPGILGYLHTSGTGILTNKLTLVNGTGGTITNLYVSYTGEVNLTNNGRSPAFAVAVNGTSVAELAYSTLGGTNSSVSSLVANLNITTNDQITITWVSDRGTGSGSSRMIGLTDVLVATSAPNLAPTDMALSSTSIAENNAVNAVIGTLSTTDPDSSDTFTYTLVAGTGSTDNASFNINGASLRASAAFDFETKSSYSIRVRTTDSANNTFEEVFSITVTDVVEGSTYNSWLNGLTPSDANAAMLDYAFGATTPGTLDPTLKPSVAIVPPAGGAGGDTATLVLTYYVRQNAVGLTVIPKTSADLAAGPSGWTTVSDDEAVGSPTTRGDGVTVQMRKASVPMIGDRKFLRVEAVQQ
jgi:hypothetical protein